jgi:hypothetical protein
LLPDGDLPLDGGPPDPNSIEQDGITFTVVLEDDEVLFEISDPSAIELLECGSTRLERRTGLGGVVPLQDDRPPSHNSPGYFLDGEYSPPRMNNGCDIAGCSGSASERVRIGFAREYVKIGTQPAPLGAPNEGEIVDVIETRAFSGDLVAYLAYSRASDECQERMVALGFTVP